MGQPFIHCVHAAPPFRIQLFTCCLGSAALFFLFHAGLGEFWHPPPTETQDSPSSVTASPSSFLATATSSLRCSGGGRSGDGAPDASQDPSGDTEASCSRSELHGPCCSGMLCPYNRSSRSSTRRKLLFSASRCSFPPSMGSALISRGLPSCSWSTSATSGCEYAAALSPGECASEDVGAMPLSPLTFLLLAILSSSSSSSEPEYSAEESASAVTLRRFVFFFRAAEGVAGACSDSGRYLFLRTQIVCRHTLITLAAASHDTPNLPELRLHSN